MAAPRYTILHHVAYLGHVVGWLDDGDFFPTDADGDERRGAGGGDGLELVAAAGLDHDFAVDVLGDLPGLDGGGGERSAESAHGPDGVGRDDGGGVAAGDADRSGAVADIGAAAGEEGAAGGCGLGGGGVGGVEEGAGAEGAGDVGDGDFLDDQAFAGALGVVEDEGGACGDRGPGGAAGGVAGAEGESALAVLVVFAVDLAEEVLAGFGAAGDADGGAVGIRLDADFELDGVGGPDAGDDEREHRDGAEGEAEFLPGGLAEIAGHGQGSF